MLNVINFLFSVLTSIWQLFLDNWLLAFAFLVSIFNLIITFYLRSIDKK